jgi:hypothetical protein
MDWKLITSGLIGALATIFLTKIFELIQKSKEHKYALQKAFFERKINAGEIAVAQWTILRSSMIALSTLTDKALEISSELGEEVSQELYSDLNKKIKEAQTATYHLANAVYFYFDIEDEKLWDNNSLIKFVDKLEQVGQLFANYSELLDYYSKLPDNEHATEIENKLDTLEREMNSKLKEIAKLFSDASKEYSILIKQIRKDVRKFEA